jgi:hypothetical protein
MPKFARGERCRRNPILNLKFQPSSLTLALRSLWAKHGAFPSVKSFAYFVFFAVKNLCLICGHLWLKNRKFLAHIALLRSVMSHCALLKKIYFMNHPKLYCHPHLSLEPRHQSAAFLPLGFGVSPDACSVGAWSLSIRIEFRFRKTASPVTKHPWQLH